MEILTRGWAQLQQAPKEDLRRLLEVLRSDQFSSSLLVQTLTRAVGDSRLGVSDLIEFFPRQEYTAINGIESAEAESTTESAPKRRKVRETSLDSVLHFVELVLLALQTLAQSGECERALIGDQISTVVDRILPLLHSTVSDLFPTSDSDLMDVDSTDVLQYAHFTSPPNASASSSSDFCSRSGRVTDRTMALRRISQNSFDILCLIFGYPAFIAVIAVLKNQNPSWWQQTTTSLSELQSLTYRIGKQLQKKRDQAVAEGTQASIQQHLWLPRAARQLWSLLTTLEQPESPLLLNPKLPYDIRKLSRPANPNEPPPPFVVPTISNYLVTEFSPPLYGTNLILQERSLGDDPQGFVCHWTGFDLILSEEIIYSRMRSVEETALLIEHLSQIHRLSQRQIYGALICSALRCDAEHSTLPAALAWRQIMAQNITVFTQINDTRWFKARSWLLSKLPQVIALLKQRYEARRASSFVVEPNLPSTDIEWAFAQVSDVGVTQRTIVVVVDPNSMEGATGPAADAIQDILYDVLKAFSDRSLIDLNALSTIAAADFFKQNLQATVKRLLDPLEPLDVQVPKSEEANIDAMLVDDTPPQPAPIEPPPKPAFETGPRDADIESIAAIALNPESSPETAVEAVNQLIDSFRSMVNLHSASSRCILQILSSDSTPATITEYLAVQLCSTPLLHVISIEGCIPAMLKILMRRCDVFGSQIGDEAHRSFEVYFMLMHHILELFQVRDDVPNRNVIDLVCQEHEAVVRPDRSPTVAWIKSYIRDALECDIPEEDGLILARSIFRPMPNSGSELPEPSTLRATFGPFKILSMLGWLFYKAVELLCASNTTYDDSWSQRMGDGLPTLMAACPYVSPVLANIVFREYRLSARDVMDEVKRFLADVMAGLLREGEEFVLPQSVKTVNEVVLSQHLGPLLDAFPSLLQKESWTILQRSGFCEAHSLDPESFSFPESFSRYRSFDSFVEGMLYLFLNHRRVDPQFWPQLKKFSRTVLPLTYARTVVLFLLKEIRGNTNYRIKLERTLRTLEFGSSLIAAATPKHLIALFDVVLDSTLPSLRSSFEAEFLAVFMITTCIKCGLPSQESALAEASASLHAFLHRVLAMLNIDAGLRTGQDPPSSRASQLASFDKYPIGAFAVTAVQLSVGLPGWWSDSAAQASTPLRAELLSRLKLWEPSVGGSFALRLLETDTSEDLIQYFWRETIPFDSENTVCFD